MHEKCSIYLIKYIAAIDWNVHHCYWAVRCEQLFGKTRASAHAVLR